MSDHNTRQTAVQGFKAGQVKGPGRIGGPVLGGT